METTAELLTPLAQPGITGSPTLSVLMRFLVLRYYAQYYSFCSIGKDFLEDLPVGRILLPADAQLESRLLHAIDSGCQAFVVDEPGVALFLELYISVHDMARQRSLDKRLILLVTQQNRPELFQLLRSHDAFRELPNVLIIVYDGEASQPTALFTTYVTTSDVLQRSVNVSLEQLPIDWTDWEGCSFFPDTTSDLKGYVLRTSTLNYMPFTGFERVEVGAGNAFDSETGERSIWLDGTELQLLVAFCELRNCNILVFPDDEDTWGEVYPNATGNGLMGSVVERRTDIALGAFYLWLKPYNFSTYTATISRSGVTMLVAKPKMLPFWRTPFLSFSLPLWAAVIVTFFAGSMAAWVAGTVRHRLLLVSGHNNARAGDDATDLIAEQLTLSDAVLMMVGFFVAQSSAVRTDLWSCVFLFATLLLAGFMVSNMYSGGLASIMTVPQYEKSIDTVRDFAATGMTWYGPTPYCLAEISSATEPHLQQILKTYIPCGIEEMGVYARKGVGGFVIEQAQHGNFAPSDFLDRASSSTLQPLKDFVFTQNCAALMTNTNPLRSDLNAYILAVQQSGLLYHIGTLSAIRYLPTDVMRNIERARMHSHGDGAIRLEIGHFLGAFFILGYGLLVAGLVFVGEVWGTMMVRRLNEVFAGKAPHEGSKRCTSRNLSHKDIEGYTVVTNID
uniref:Ionotropic glutamate receptor C-terminal domain-containing protein n=1 Tax=Anopheles dirus TaxID=7168 RepID=A0A182NL37_9DIPT